MADDNVIFDELLIKSFRQMWNKFPDSALLIYRDRTIVSMNECAERQYGGILSPGIKCNSVNPESHKGCRANEALNKKETITMEYQMGGEDRLSYWQPVEGEADYFIHFSVKK
jgi:hypothetical protein